MLNICKADIAEKGPGDSRKIENQSFTRDFAGVCGSEQRGFVLDIFRQ